MPTLLHLDVEGPVPDGFAPYVCARSLELGADRPEDAPTLVPTGPNRWSLRVRLSGMAHPHSPLDLRLGIRSIAQEDFRMGRGLLPAPSGMRLHTHAEAEPDRAMDIFYYSPWPEARLRVALDGEGRNEEVVLPLTKDGSGLERGEICWTARVPGELVDTGFRFVVEGPDGAKDTPVHSGGWYRPLATTVHLRNGEIFSERPPESRRPGRVETIRVPCPEMEHDFTIHLVLPRDFGARDAQEYPVVFLNDGQNQISGRGESGGWHIDTTAAQLIQAGRMREAVLAAVEMHPDRNRGYLAPGDRQVALGQADVYTDFLADRVLPLLRARYRVSGGEHAVVMGASNGAIHALYATLRRPGDFGRAGCLSYAILDPEVNRARLAEPGTPLPERVYLDSGTRWAPHDSQEDSDDNVLVTHDLRDALLRRGLVLERDVRHLIAYGDPHNEVAWRRRASGCLEFLVPPL